MWIFLSERSDNLSYLTSCHIYHPQAKFAKVMFSQVFVCPWGRSRSLSREVSAHWESLSRGSQSGGRSLSRGSLSKEKKVGKELAVRILLESILVELIICCFLPKIYLCSLLVKIIYII